MPRSPRLAHKAPVIQASMVAHFRNTYCRASVHTYNGDFGAISVREKSFTAPVLKSGLSNIGLFFAAFLRRNRTAIVAEVNEKERGLEPTVTRSSGSKASER